MYPIIAISPAVQYVMNIAQYFSQGYIYHYGTLVRPQVFKAASNNYWIFIKQMKCALFLSFTLEPTFGWSVNVFTS